MLATLFPISPYLGSLFVVKGFAVALVGGLGNVGGAVVAALVIGLTEAIIAGFGYSECNWVFTLLGEVVGESLDEMKRKYEAQRDRKFAARVCSKHPRATSPNKV